jgi:acyl dehydratase
MQPIVKDQVYFEDAVVGTQLPSLVKGPVSLTTVVKFAGPSGDFAPIHHDIEVAKSRGLPGPIIMGPLKWAYLFQMITDWAGPQGVLQQIEFRLTQMDLVGDTLIAKGRMSRKYTDKGKNCVECDVWLENTKMDKPSIIGKALVCLPSRNEKPPDGRGEHHSGKS